MARPLGSPSSLAQRLPDERARRSPPLSAPSPSRTAVLHQSYERCAALGLSRIERLDHSPLGRVDLALTRERNQRLHVHAVPVMEMLFEQIAGTESMVVLCDATGTIIHSIGDDDFLTRASKVALQPGVNWSEQSKGTNAIGTTLIEEEPTLVHADEHFMHANHFLTCSAAPIQDPRGNILGALDVTGDHRSYHQHTMALVRMSARMIENHWLGDDHRNALRLHVHRRLEFIGTLMEGILAVSPDGRFVGANRGALEQLGLSGAALRRHSLVSLFGTTVGALVDRFRSPQARPLEVHAHGGRSFHVHARFEGPVWSSVYEAPSPAGGSASAPGGVVAAASSDAGPSLADLQTGDVQMGAVIAKLRRVQDRDIPVLLMGEPGTGKELLARAMHRDSVRHHRPFVVVHCASISSTGIEAELLGVLDFGGLGVQHEDSVGQRLQARGGTLFLDEIGDLPLPMQARLLRVLRDRQGAPQAGASMPADVAIVCATQRNLQDLIATQAFREDLYHCLNGLTVKLPALRERSDLAVLVRRILDGGGEDQGQGRRLRLSAQALELFERHPWPGNLRQLDNVLRTASVLAGPDPEITTDHLPDDFLENVRRHGVAQPAAGPAPAPVGPAGAGVAAPLALPVGRSLHALQLEAIHAAVQACGGNISVAARRLGVSRNTIYRKLRAGPAAEI